MSHFFDQLTLWIIILLRLYGVNRMILNLEKCLYQLWLILFVLFENIWYGMNEWTDRTEPGPCKNFPSPVPVNFIEYESELHIVKSRTEEYGKKINETGLQSVCKQKRQWFKIHLRFEMLQQLHLRLNRHQMFKMIFDQFLSTSKPKIDFHNDFFWWGGKKITY